MLNAQSRLTKNRGILTIILIFVVSSTLVYVSFYPDVPLIKQINDVPRRTGAGYTEPIVSNPQIAIVPPPTPSVDNTIPPEEKAASSALNAIVAVSLATLGGFGTYILFKHRRSVAKNLFSILILFLAVVTAYFFAGNVVDVLEFASVPVGQWLKLFLSIAASAVFGVFAARTLLMPGIRGETKKLVNVLTGTLAGSFIVTVVPFYINLLISVSFALYDAYSVKWGAVKSLAKIDDAVAAVVAFEGGGWSFGLGDVIVYAMLPASCLTYAMLYLPRYAFYGLSSLIGLLTPWLIFIIVALAVLAGIFATLKLLERQTIMPGLTIPILAGSCAFGLCILVMQLVNYTIWGWFVPIL